MDQHAGFDLVIAPDLEQVLEGWVDLIDISQFMPAEGNPILAAAKPKPFFVLASPLQQRSRMKAASELHADECTPKYRNPAAVFSAPAAFLKMRFVEPEIVAFDLAEPMIFKL